MRILIIEDEATLRNNLKQQLLERGFTVDTAADGEEGLRIGTECELDAAIVDLGLPGIDGMEVIRRLRSAGNDVPLLVLTARDGWSEKVDALTAGADDYMTKPFAFEEVVARLNAVVRRAAYGKEVGEISCPPVLFDIYRQRVLLKGKLVSLSTYESRMLQCLMVQSGKMVSKRVLARETYEQEFERHSNALEVQVARLRRKLDPDEDLRPIRTVRGFGYLFSLPRER